MSDEMESYNGMEFPTPTEAWEWIKSNVPPEDVGLLTVAIALGGTAGGTAYGIYWLSKEIRRRME